MKYFSLVTTLSVVLLASFSGCTRRDSLPADMPKLESCTLTFTQDGAPLQDALVSLFPVDGSKWSATGRTDSKGVCAPQTQGRYPGVAQGKYKVTVSKILSEESKMGSPPSDDADSPAYKEWQEKKDKEVIPAYQLVNGEYTNRSSTKQEIEIKPGKNTETIDVGKAVKDAI